jgi:hypothetical protein
MFTLQELTSLNVITERFSRKITHAKMQNFEEFMGYLYTFLDEVEVGYQLGIEEYLYDLTYRDLAEQLLEEIPLHVKKKLMPLFSKWDEQFTQLTAATQAPLLGGRPEWWWSRVPKNLVGDLQKDIASLGVQIRK